MTNQRSTATHDTATLIDDLGSEFWVDRHRASVALEHELPAVIAPLSAAAVSSPEGDVRWEAVKLLARHPEDVEPGVFISALEDEMSSVRWLAAEGLSAAGSKAIPDLLRRLVTPAQPWIYEGAHRVLRGKRDHALGGVIDALESPFAADEVPLAASRALESFQENGGGRRH